MRVEMVLGLKDVPGVLVRALEPVSANGGNIVSVLHSRGGGDLVTVNLVFSASDEQMLERILGALKKASISVREVRVEGRKFLSKLVLSFVFIGHVIDQDIQDTIDRINRIGLVRDVDVRMSDPDEESAVLMNVEVDARRLDRLFECVEGICKRKRFLLIREVL